MAVSKYKVCDKCGVRHSTLVKHKCFKPEGQKEKPKWDKLPPGEGEGGGDGQGGAGDPDEGQGEGQGDGQSDDGQGEGEGEGEGTEGEGDGSEGEGDGEEKEGKGKKGQGQKEAEGEGEGEGQAEGQADDEPPPAAVVVTVLKFAALTAQCSKRAGMSFSLSEEGLVVVGVANGKVARRTIPWGEFEQRSTRDGEDMVKEVIDAVEDEVSPLAA